ncbi:MAG: flavin reductase family protein [Gammaproteobacteria bacterium]
MNTKVNQSQSLRNVFGKFATGVSVVSFFDKNKNPLGITVNSFTSVSLNPSLALWCIDNKSELFDDLNSSKNYIFNFLSDEQINIATKLSEKNNHSLTDISHDNHPSGPIIKNSLGWMACTKKEIIPAGDHLIILGFVKEFKATEKDLNPLIFWSGSYQKIN